jgi:hypothetical protein
MFERLKSLLTRKPTKRSVRTVHAPHRVRGRYEVANNSYARGIVLTLANDCVGTGPRLQMLTDEEPTNRQVEQEFLRWTEAVSLPEKLRTLRIARAQDGEAFCMLTANPKLDSPVSGGASIRCYYGNPAAADGQDPPSVWDSGFKGVWHLHDDLLNSVTGVAATDTGTVGFSAAKVGNGREGDGGTGDGLTTDIAGLGAGAIHTLEGWAVNHTFSGTGYYGIFGSRQWQRSVALSTTNVPNGNWMLNVGSQEGVQPGGGPTLGQWYHCALVLDGSNARFYVNGTQVGPDYAYTWAGENTTPLRLLANQYANNGLDGCLDEARYSQVARSVEWVKFEVANIVNAGNEQVWGPEQLAAPVPWHLMLQGAV